MLNTSLPNQLSRPNNNHKPSFRNAPENDRFVVENLVLEQADNMAWSMPGEHPDDTGLMKSLSKSLGIRSKNKLDTAVASTAESIGTDHSKGLVSDLAAATGKSENKVDVALGQYLLSVTA